MIPQPTHCGVALCLLSLPGLQKGTGSLSCSLGSPCRSPPLGSPQRSLALRAGFLAQNLQTALYKKTKRAVCSPAPRLPAAWPRQAVRGRPVGSELVRIKGAGMGPRCGPSASEILEAAISTTPRIPHRDGSAEDSLQRLEGGEELFRPDRPPLNVQASGVFPTGCRSTGVVLRRRILHDLLGNRARSDVRLPRVQVGELDEGVPESSAGSVRFHKDLLESPGAKDFDLEIRVDDDEIAIGERHAERRMSRA